MSETTPNQPDDSPVDPGTPKLRPSQSPPVRPRKRRRWPWVIGGILVLLVLLVALAPTLLSTGPARSFVVSKINDNLNGTMAMKDWSIGWTSGVTINEIKIDDEQGARVLEIARVRVPVSLLGAIRGDIDLGETVIDKPNLVNVRVNEDGSTNLENLAKPAPEEPTTDEPTRLPDIRGSVKINDLRASITGPGVAAPIEVEPSSFAFSIPGINQPIENSGKLVYRVGDAPAGAIGISGSIDAIENNQVDLGQLKADQKLEIANADLSAAAPFIKSETETVTLAGVGNGTLALKANGLKSASVDGQLAVTNLAFGGTPLSGDTYRSSKVNVPIKVSTSASGSDTLIRIETLKVETDHVLVDVSGQATQQALENLAAQKAPGSAGTFAVVMNTRDLPGLVHSLPNTFGLQPDVKLEQGAVNLRIDLALEAQRTVITQKLDAQARGTNAGKPVQLDPVNLSTSVALHPGGGPIPDLRDIAMELKSVFATVTGGGASLANLNIKGNLDLARAQQQLGQFADFGKLDLAGGGDFQIVSKGDLTTAGGTSDVQASLSFANLVVRGLEGKEDLNQPRLAIGADATLVRGPEGGEFIDRIKNATATVQAGEANAPVLDVLVNAANITLATLGAERFEVQKLNVPDLARAQQQFAAFVPPDLNLRGDLTVAAVGSYRGNAVTLETLNIDSSEKYLSVRKGDAPLVIQVKDGAVGGNGTLAISSNLKSALDAVQGTAETASAEPGQLTSGQLDATVTLSGQAGAATAIGLDGAITNLGVRTHAEPIENEKVAMAVKATASADMTSVEVTSAVIDSAFAMTTVKDAKLKLDGDTFEMLQKAIVQVNIPDLARTYAISQAFVAPATQPAEESATTQPTAPLNMAGSAVVNLDVTRQGGITRVNVPEIAADNLALSRGERAFAFDKPVSLKLAAELGTKAVPTTASTQPVEQIDQIKLTQLSGDLGGVATFSAPAGVTVSGLTAETPAANGKLGVNGALEPLMRLLSVVQDAEPMPYRGEYALEQTVGTQAGTIALAGGMTINQFQVLGPDGNPQFTEDRLVLANDLLADPENKIATIRNVELSMPSSQAASVKLVGKIEDWEAQRKLVGTQLVVTPDLEKLWPVIKPMLAPETQESLSDLKIAGKNPWTFDIAGSYPGVNAAGEPLAFEASIRALRVNGGLTVALLDTSGINVQDLELPITLNDGQLITLYMNRPREERAAKPAQVNGGVLDLNSIVVTLTEEIPRLSIGKDQKIVIGASFNPLLSDSVGKFINPVFANSTRAQGLIDLTVVTCDNLALGEALKTPKSGSATFTFSLREMDIANPLGSLLFADTLKKVGLGSQAAETDAFRGRVQNAVITIANGIVNEKIVFEVGKKPPAGAIAASPEALQLFPMSFEGTVALADLRQNLKVTLPPQMFNSSDIERFFPGGIPVTLRGTTTKPELDLGSFARSFVEAQAKARLGDVLGGDRKSGQKENPVGGMLEDVLGGRKRQEEQRGTTQPAEPAREPDPVGGLLNDILGGRKRK